MTHITRIAAAVLIAAIAAGCALNGGGLIPRKGGGDGPVHCHGARCP